MAAGKFTLVRGEETTDLEWGTFAMHRFCQLCGNLPLSGLLSIYDSNTFSLQHVINMIRAAAESATEGLEVSERTAARWIDEAGGLTDPQSNVLAFIRFTNGQTVPDTTEQPDEGEKKSP